MQNVRSIDAHGGGASLRIIVEGFPAPQGRTMAEKLAWAGRHAHGLRRSLMRQPRGHQDLSGAILTEPVHAGSHAGVIFMDGSGFPQAVTHGLVTLITVALERGLIMPGGDGDHVVLDTVAGTIRGRATLAREHRDDPVRVTRVACTMPPAFVLRGGVAVRAAGRVVPADLAFAGACHAVVDSEAAGLGLTSAHVPEIRRMGTAILSAVNQAMHVSHPVDSVVQGVHGVVFSGPPDSSSADVRAVMMTGEGQISAAPAESGMAAILAVLDAMGLLADEGALRTESLAGATWTARIGRRTRVGDFDAILPEVEGQAWITGDHRFLLPSGDPLVEGFPG